METTESNGSRHHDTRLRLEGVSPQPTPWRLLLSTSQAAQESLPQDYLFFVGDTGPMLDAIEEFLTGALPAHRSDRVLATVLYTDIVRSTEQLTRLGDRRWKELLLTHDELVRAEVERFRGRLVRSTGDGVLATFDGPGRAVRCACALRDALRPLGLDIRAGLHSGEIELREMTWLGWLSTSGRGCQHSLARGRYSSRARLPTSLPARVSSSRTAESTNSRASQGLGICTRSSPESPH